jgi:menaquinone-dependent protoporphyrinogen IX oxidase
MLIVPSACPACIPASSGKTNPIAISFSAAAKAAERKKRFDEARKKLKNSDPHPQVINALGGEVNFVGRYL